MYMDIDVTAVELYHNDMYSNNKAQ